MAAKQPTTAAIIRAARLACGLSQQDLADRLGIASITVSKWERGVHTPSWETLVQVAEVLGGQMEARIELPAAPAKARKR